MIHEMKLQPEYYNYILHGTKRVEIRLNDEKRKNIKVNNKIIFLKEPDLNESFEAKVVKLIKYNSFEEMVKNYDISVLADKTITKKSLLADLEKYYPKEKQNKFGVLCIEIELI